MIHTCIRATCAKKYEDNDEEPYYCPECQAEKKALAAKIDAQVAARPRQTMSALQAFDAQAVDGFVKIKL